MHFYRHDKLNCSIEVLLLDSNMFTKLANIFRSKKSTIPNPNNEIIEPSTNHTNQLDGFGMVFKSEN